MAAAATTLTFRCVVAVAVAVAAAAGLRPGSGSGSGSGFITDWGVAGGGGGGGGGRQNQPTTCVDVPRNMSLCHDIGYEKMRLPNLLDHDTMAEVSQQAASWVPLLNVRCHPDTQLFLCSLFSPVCLDRPIYPCRNLCVKVKRGCEGRMKTYGFPWPDMFSCDKFPLDNDMCIRPRPAADPIQGENCQVCNQVETYENILDNFCRADFAIRAKFKRVKKLHLATCKKAKVLKGGGGGKLRRPVLSLDPITDVCCEEKTKSNRGTYLIMGVFRDTKLVPTFIMPWAAKHSKAFKKAVRMFKKLNCTDPKLVSHSVIGKSFKVNVTGSFIMPMNKGGDITSATGIAQRRRRGKSKPKSKMKPKAITQYRDIGTYTCKKEKENAFLRDVKKKL